MDSHDLWSSVTHVLHSASCFWVSSLWQHALEPHSFLWPNNIPSCGQTALCTHPPAERPLSCFRSRLLCLLVLRP